MEEYLGLTVRLTLHENLIVEGIVSALDLKTQSLTLSKVKARSNNQAPWKHQEKVILKGSDITDLEILPDGPADTTAPTQPRPKDALSVPSQPPPGLSSKNTTMFSASDIERSLMASDRGADPYQRVNVQTLLAKPLPKAATSSATIPPLPSLPQDPAIVSTVPVVKPAQPFPTYPHRASIQVSSLDEDFRRLDLDTLGSSDARTSMARPGTKNPLLRHSAYEAGSAQWHGTDVKEYLKEDFDFQDSLKQFDKQKVFEEFRSELEAKKGKTTLAAINKPKKDDVHGPPALAPSSSTLPSASLPGRMPSELRSAEPHVPPPALSPTALPLVPEARHHTSPAVLWNSAGPTLLRNGVKAEPSVIILKHLNALYTRQGLCLPLLPASQAAKVFTYATNRWGPNTVQMIENAARSFLESLAMLSPGLSKAVILAGVHKIGAMGLAIGRHLTNRGVSVTAFIHGGEKALGASDLEQEKDMKTFSFQKEIGLRHHVKMVHGDVDQLFAEAALNAETGNVVIIDALCNFEEDEHAEPFALKSATKLSQWLLTTEAPIFSLHAVARVQKGPAAELAYLPSKCIFSLALPSAELAPFFRAHQDARVGAKGKPKGLPRVFAMDVGVSPHLWNKLVSSSAASDSAFAKKLTQDTAYLPLLMRLFCQAGYVELFYHEHES